MAYCAALLLSRMLVSDVTSINRLVAVSSRLRGVIGRELKVLQHGVHEAFRSVAGGFQL